MNIEILAIIGILFFSFLLILRDLRMSFYVLIVLSVLLHKELFSFFRWDLMPIRIFMLAVLLAGVYSLLDSVFRKRFSKESFKNFLGNPFLLSLLLLWVVRAISIVNTKNIQASVLLFGFFSTAVVLVLMLYQYFKDNNIEVLKYLRFYIYTVFGLSLFGYFQYFLHSKYDLTIGALWSIPNNTPRVGATFWDVNHYGALIASLLPILCVLLISEGTKKKKLLYLVMIVSLIVALLLTNSRTAWILDFVAFVFFISVLFFKKFGAKGIAYVFFAFVLLVTPGIIEYSHKDSPFRARIKQYFHYRLDSFDSHFLLLTGAGEVFEQYPIIGGGYGGFFEHFSKTKIAATYFGRDPAGLNTRVPAHTIWGELLSETGVLGFGTFLMFSIVIIFTLLFVTFNAHTFQESLLSLAMASVYVGWMVAGIFYSYNSEFFWIVITLFYLYGYSALKSKYSLNEIFSYFVKSQKTIVFILLFLSSILIFSGLGSTHLIPWDEAIYAKISKNMLLTNEYAVLHWWPDKVWLEKPPLYMWMMAFAMKIMGISSLAVRFPSAIFGIGTIILTYFFGKKLFNKTVGYISALTLLTNIHFLYYSRSSMLDITVTFFITLSLYLYYLAKNSQKLSKWVFSGLALGAALMTKGVIGGIPLLIIGLHEIYLFVSKKQQFNKPLFKGYFGLLFSALLVALPWHVLMYFKFGQPFISTYLGYHVLSRATTGIEDKGRPVWWYIIVMKVSMRLWFIALLGSIPFSIKKSLKDQRYIWLLFCSMSIFLFFSLPKSKVVWYILPIYPVLGIIIGSFLEQMLNIVITKFKRLDTLYFKVLALYVLTLTVLTYLFLNKELVYVGDLTGSQARLIQLKDKEFGKDAFVYIDRTELPLAMFYTDGPFEVIDFLPTQESRVPDVTADQDLILVTKKGRYSDRVAGYTYNSTLVQEDGDWVLWFVESNVGHEKRVQKELEKELNK